MGNLRFLIGLVFVFNIGYFANGQNYEVADIDCAIGTGGKELLTARLRRPDGFRGTPIFADDRGQSLKDPFPPVIMHNLMEDLPCQIIQDPKDTSGRVFMLRITDFSQCGVMKRNGFINVRVWFPQLPGVVMLSDQEVIIMCKPPAATVVQSKTAGFAGSIPSGARISGVVEETPGRLEYEVALYKETSTNSLAGRSSTGAGAYITGADSHELPVDQAVPIGTRLQLRAKINSDSAWKHAKLMEVSVSPDAKNPNADGSVALVRDGCRNPDLASIIPKQPYRYKERTNEVVLDFEAFLLSNMADRSTLWLHTQIKACMESQDCHPEFCMDVYQPSGYGKRRKRRNPDFNSGSVTSSMGMSKTNATSMEYSSPLSQHWRTYTDEIIIDNEPQHRSEDEDILNLNQNSSNFDNFNVLLHKMRMSQGSQDIQDPPHSLDLVSLPLLSERAVSSDNVHKEDIDNRVHKYLTKHPSSSTTFRSTSTMGSQTVQSSTTSTTSSTSSSTNRPLKSPQVNGNSVSSGETVSTKFGDNIGFSVIMPSDYYRSAEVLATYECRGWATATLFSLLGAFAAGLVACAMSYKARRSNSSKEKSLYSIHSISPNSVPIRSHCKDPQTIGIGVNCSKTRDSGQHHKYARDTSIYRS